MNSGSSGTTWARPGATMVAHSRVWKDSGGWPFRVRVEQCRQWTLAERWYSVPSSAISRWEPSRWKALIPPERSSAATAAANAGKEVIGRHRIEHVADVVVGGNAADAEQGLAVRAAVAGLKLALMIQEGRALGEEHLPPIIFPGRPERWWG